MKNGRKTAIPEVHVLESSKSSKYKAKINSNYQTKTYRNLKGSGTDGTRFSGGRFSVKTEQ